MEIRKKSTRAVIHIITYATPNNLLICSDDLMDDKAKIYIYSTRNLKGDLHGMTLLHATSLRQAYDTNWRGARKKALSDFWSVARFSSQIALYSLVEQKENMILHQKSLGTLFHTPLQLFHVNQTYNSLMTAVYVTKNVIGF